MKKLLIGAMAAVVTAGSFASVATTAEAQPYRYRHHRDNDNDTAAAAIVGGVVGLALGAAIAGSNNDRRYYDRRYYDRGYYAPRYYGRSYYDRSYYGRPYYGRPAYAYGYGHRVCTSRDRVYDPYIGRRVTVRRSYPC